MAEVQRTIVNTDKAPQPIGAYSQAIRIRGGELMFIAGQVAVDINGELVGANDVGAQARQIFENLENILAGVGANMSNVLEFTTYVVGKENVQPYIKARSEIYPSLFPNGGYPANTLLVISGLVKDEYLLEIKAVAALP